MKFRKKPVVIEAEQFFKKKQLWPAGICTAMCSCRTLDRKNNPHIHTLEGIMDVQDGDWIITGVKGERYPCKPDIFEATYEKADPDA